MFGRDVPPISRSAWHEVTLSSLSHRLPVTHERCVSWTSRSIPWPGIFRVLDMCGWNSLCCAATACWGRICPCHSELTALRRNVSLSLVRAVCENVEPEQPTGRLGGWPLWNIVSKEDFLEAIATLQHISCGHLLWPQLAGGGFAHAIWN